MVTVTTASNVMGAEVAAIVLVGATVGSMEALAVGIDVSTIGIVSFNNGSAQFGWRVLTFDDMM